MTKIITFMVIQIGNDIVKGEIVPVHEVKGEFPATLHGIRKAFKAADDACYGDEAGRIAPTGRGIVVACVDGKQIIDRNGDVYKIDVLAMDTDFHYYATRRKITKTELFSNLMNVIDRYLSETANV